MGAIYKIYNDVNDKIYIGQSVRPEQRWREHQNYAKQNERKTILYNAMRKYGIEKFHFAVIKECPQEELNYYEEYYIREYNSIYPNGYNMTYGGESGKKLDYDDVVEKYRECENNEAELYRRYGIHPSTTKYILKEKGIIPEPNKVKQGVPYYECDINGNILYRFNNAAEIAEKYKDLGITIAGINNFIGHQLNNRQKTYKGKYFYRVSDYEKYDYKNRKIPKHKSYKAVRCIETGQQFEKIADAARWIKDTYPEYKGSVDTVSANISKSIKNNHSSYNHTWCFIDD